MSNNLYWSPPPIERTQNSNREFATRGIVSRLVFGHDGSIHSEGVILRDSPEHHYLRGVADASGPDIRTDIADLLAVVVEFGAAQVWTGEQ